MAGVREIAASASRAGAAPRPPRATQPPLRLRWDRISALAVLIGFLLLTGIHGLFRGSDSSAAALAGRPTPTPTRTAAVSCHPGRTVIREAPPVPDAPTARTVALTFDDGPSSWTPAVLAALHQAGIRATFFMIGSQAARTPEVVRQVAAAGEVIGNHTWSHPSVSPKVGWNAGRLATELTRTDSTLRRITGSRTCLFRPPGGVLAGAAGPAARAALSVVLWSVDTRDWASDRQATPDAAAAVLTRAREGLTQPHPVLLLHDGGGNRAGTVAALPAIIGEYRAHGYRFVTLTA